MSNLKYLLLLVLISFSLQDNNCLISYESCDDGEDYEEETPITKGDIDNCLYYEDDTGKKCEECKSGYAMSYDQKICKKFDNCRRLDHSDNTKCSYCKEGYVLSTDATKCIKLDNCWVIASDDEKCQTCYSHYHPNKKGICERTLCSDYDANDECKKCYDGYYLKDKKCEKITIQNCVELDETDSTKCKRCVAISNYYNTITGIEYIITPDKDGKCDTTKIVPMCTAYNSNGECTSCDSDYEISKDKKSCTLKSCKNKVNYCYICKAGYFVDKDDLCMGYDGSKDTSSNSSSNRIRTEYSLLILILMILI